MPHSVLASGISRSLKERYSRNPASLGEFPTPSASVVAAPFLQSGKAASGVTVVTQCSVDRLPRLEAMCRSWAGAISCAVHVPRGESVAEFAETLKAFHEKVEGIEGGAALFLSLRQETGEVVEWARGLYPINALRNVALDAARTARVLCLDVDFELSENAARVLRECSAKYVGRKTALVVPAFEVHAGRESEILGAKESLKALVDEGVASGFHVGHFPQGHSATDFDRFFGASSGGAYRIDYQACYEPYIVAEKALLPRYDERFRGYGLNKVSHLMACSRAGFEFVVAEEAWCVSPEMAKSEAWKKMYKKGEKDPLLAIRVQVLFDKFKQELAVPTVAKAEAEARAPAPAPGDFDLDFGHADIAKAAKTAVEIPGVADVGEVVASLRKAVLAGAAVIALMSAAEMAGLGVAGEHLRGSIGY